MSSTQQSLRGRTALVTGATSGIGRATAIQLAREGAEVIVHGRVMARSPPGLRHPRDPFRVRQARAALGRPRHSGGPMTSEAVHFDRDYPQLVGDRGLIEPAPRRVRGYFDGELVFDTIGARYVWESKYYPQYYIPVSDVRMRFVEDEDHVQKLQLGSSRLYSLASSKRTLKSAVRLYDMGPVVNYMRFEWDALDWFEEDEPIILHPRNPYVRVDTLRSHRHVKVELDGVVLADTHSSLMLFETGLPTRYYIDRTDVDFSHLEPSETESVCPYKGVTSGYWSARVGEAVHPDIAWAYDYPLREVGPIAGTIAFYNEKLDISIDDVRLPRPHTIFA